MVVSSSIEALGNEVVVELSILQKAVDAFAYLELYPPFTHKVVEIIIENKFLWDIRQANTRVFTTIEGGSQVEVAPRTSSPLMWLSGLLKRYRCQLVF